MGDATLAEIIRHPAWAYTHPEHELLEVHVSKDSQWPMTDLIASAAIAHPHYYAVNNAEEIINNSASLQAVFYAILEYKWNPDCNLFSDERIKGQVSSIFGEHQTKPIKLIETTRKAKLWLDCASELVAELCGNIGDFDDECFGSSLSDFKSTLQTVCAQYTLVWDAYLAPIDEGQ